MMFLHKLSRPLCLPLLCSALACDAPGPGVVNEGGVDTDVPVEDEASDSGFGGSESSSGGFGDDAGGSDELQDKLDPSAAGWGGWVGGFGGSATSQGCPWEHSVIGVAASSTGNYVRQFAVVCGPNAEIEAANTVETEDQWIIASGYYSNRWPGGLVAPNWGSRISWDASVILGGAAQLKASGTSYHLCNPGYRVSKVDVRAGTYVDRIESITCEWVGPGGPPGGLVIYPRSVGVGGWGGSLMSSSCQGRSDFDGKDYADGAGFRSMYWLDGFRLWCD